MATGGQKRTRSERVAAIELPPGQWERAWIGLRRGDVLARIVLTLAASAALCVAIRGWDPPFAYRVGFVPMRDIVARAAFSQEDPAATLAAKRQARSEVRFIFAQDPKPLEQLRASLHNTVVELTAAPTLATANMKLWRDFQPSVPPGAAPPPLSPEQQFQSFRAAFVGQENLARFDRALAAAFSPFEHRGLLNLEKLPPQPAKGDQPARGNQEEILVHPAGHDEPLEVVKIADVLIGDGTALHRTLATQLQNKEVADRVFAWIRPRLTATLQRDEPATKRAEDEAVKAVEPVRIEYPGGANARSGGSAAGEQAD